MRLFLKTVLHRSVPLSRCFLMTSLIVQTTMWLTVSIPNTTTVWCLPHVIAVPALRLHMFWLPFLRSLGSLWASYDFHWTYVWVPGSPWGHSGHFARSWKYFNRCPWTKLVVYFGRHFDTQMLGSHQLSCQLAHKSSLICCRKSGNHKICLIL